LYFLGFSHKTPVLVQFFCSAVKLFPLHCENVIPFHIKSWKQLKKLLHV